MYNFLQSRFLSGDNFKPNKNIYASTKKMHHKSNRIISQINHKDGRY